MNTLMSTVVVALAWGDCPSCAPQAFERAAWIEVACPADVMLTIQGHRMHLTGTLRRFASPPLPVGRVFTYELRAFRDGREVAVRQVEVEAGRITRVDLAEASLVVNFGVDVERLRQGNRSEGATVPKEPTSPKAGDDPLPDPSRRRLTVIGAEEERRRARDELAGPLKEFAADYVVQDYAPDHWAVTKAGFVTTGRPTVYAQEADGRVLFRQDDLTDLRLNLEAVRKPSPDYKPERDPDHRKTPGLPATWLEWLPFAAIALAGWLLWKSRL